MSRAHKVQEEHRNAQSALKLRTLQIRIRTMAKRWDYDREEYENAIELAKQDPEAWEALVAHDEARWGAAATKVAQEPKVSQAYPYGTQKPHQPYTAYKCYWHDDI